MVKRAFGDELLLARQNYLNGKPPFYMRKLT